MCKHVLSEIRQSPSASESRVELPSTVHSGSRPGSARETDGDVGPQPGCSCTPGGETTLSTLSTPPFNPFSCQPFQPGFGLENARLAVRVFFWGGAWEKGWGEGIVTAFRRLDVRSRHTACIFFLERKRYTRYT